MQQAMCWLHTSPINYTTYTLTLIYRSKLLNTPMYFTPNNSLVWQLSNFQLDMTVTIGILMPVIQLSHGCDVLVQVLLRLLF